jgi:hypothetical protein
MNKLKSTILVLLMVLVGQSVAQGQSELDQLAGKIKSIVEAAEPGWKCERGQPFMAPGQTEPPPHLLIEVCDLRAMVRGPYPTPSEMVVRHVVIHATAGSEENARRSVHDTIVDSRNNWRHYQPLKDLGDEAYTYGINNADILVRSGRFVFDVNTVVAVERDPDGYTLNLHDRGAREKSEQLRITPLFAQHVLAAVQ